MKLLAKVLGGLVVVIVLVAAIGYFWAGYTTNQRLAQSFDSHTVDLPTPFPLSEAELGELGLEEDIGGALALERALERGRHLVQARYACTECHGGDFSGGVMVDAFPIGTLLGPNLTGGVGGRVANYTATDWDRAVRHGILPDGRPSIMPSEDFLLMSDQELSDIIVYIQAQPPVDNEVPAPTFGPLGRVLIATEQIALTAEMIPDHSAPHRAFPPATAVTVEFGAHLAGVCVGCHGHDMAGGPIVGGDPSWPPARNLTPHADGLTGWSYDQFRAAMRDGVRPDGTELVEPMTLVTPYAQSMTEVELQAIWAYLESLQPTPTPAS